MFKHLIFLIVLSLVVVLTLAYLNTGLMWFLNLHGFIAGLLGQIFATNYLGTLFIRLIALFAIPVIVSAVIALIYWIFKRHLMPHVIELTWILWFVLATIIVFQG